MQKRFEVWAVSSGGRHEIVATFPSREEAYREAARIHWVYKRVYVDFGFYR